MSGFLYDSKEGRRVACGVQGSSMYHLSSSMEALFKNGSILGAEDMQYPSNVLSDTRISIGFGHGYGDEKVKL